MTIEIKVPDIGDFDGVEIIEVLVKAGDTVVAEQSIITVESDKASMEIPCPQAGVVKEMKVKIGDKVKEGTLMLILEPAEGGAAVAPPKVEEAPKADAPKVEAPKAEAPKAAAPAPAATVAPTPAEPHNPTAASVNAPHASPSVRKFARELGVNLTTVQGTGPKVVSRPTTYETS
ncbi:dihydrolipoamide acetyltransferase (E2) component of pyruvate dehydrogenase complex [Limnobacter sp. MED105]|nr:dihydrolipoamide acetyltransferase (E2) component of pyruvate dehydrogenase complex [Limnobacter sp. MED105]